MKSVGFWCEQDWDLGSLARVRILIPFYREHYDAATQVALMCANSIDTELVLFKIMTDWDWSW